MNVHDVVEAWRNRGATNGWTYPDEWEVPEVAAVAKAFLTGMDMRGPLAALASVRAREGHGLRETLANIVALHMVLRGVEPPSAWLRAVAIGWSDVVARELAMTRVDDGLTGLSTGAYLRTRLFEVYEQCSSEGISASAKYCLVILSVSLGELSWLDRMAAMMLVADSMGLAFSNGETRALVTPSTAVVLSARGPLVPARMCAAGQLISDRFASTGFPVNLVRPRCMSLPAAYEDACRLISDLPH